MDDELEFELALDSAAIVWQQDKTKLLTERTRKREIVEPRQVLACYSHYFCSFSQEKSVEQFGLSRTSFFHSQKCVRNFFGKDKSFTSKVRLFLKDLGVEEKTFIFSLNN